LRNSGPPAVFCTTVRANGTRANPCPAGPWDAIGAKMGKPVWKDDRWIADTAKDYGFGATEAKTFIETLADQLGVDRRFIRGSYEDVLYYLHKEQRLPVNVTPPTPGWKIPRRGQTPGSHIRKRFGSGGRLRPAPAIRILEKRPVAPAQRAHVPVARRLPGRAASAPGILPWVSEADFPHDHPLDPMADRDPLPDPHDGQRFIDGAGEPAAGEGVRTQPAPFDDPEPVVGESAAWVVRTALMRAAPPGTAVCVHAAHRLTGGYLELIAAIEATAAATGFPVVIEGYAPPPDPG
jgi:uncharacterized protein (DUF2126 family)